MLIRISTKDLLRDVRALPVLRPARESEHLLFLLVVEPPEAGHDVLGHGGAVGHDQGQLGHDDVAGVKVGGGHQAEAAA